MDQDYKQTMWEKYEEAKQRNVIRLLIRYAKLIMLETEKMADASGHHNFKRQYMAFLHNIGPVGTTPTELAKMVWVTKQAMSKTLKEMERGGYIVLEPHHQDGRALTIRLSERGEELIELSRKMSEEITQEMKQIAGEEAIEQLIGTLQVLLEDAERKMEG